MTDGLRRHFARTAWTFLFPAAVVAAAVFWIPDRNVPMPPSRPVRPSPPPWQPPTDPQLLARLEDPDERVMAIYDVDMGDHGDLEVARTIPLPARDDGEPRSIEITRRGRGFTQWSWILRQGEIEIDSGEWGFGP